MKTFVIAAAAGTCLLTGAGALDGGQPLTLQVSPLMAPAPAFVSVRALVEASDDNRALEVIAQSPDFYRSSLIELEGDQAPRTSVVEFRSVPGGNYQISARLLGQGGESRAYMRRQVDVLESGGR